METRKTADSEESAYLTVAQVAQLLDVCEKTVRAAIRAGQLAAVRVGRTIRIPRRALAGREPGRR
jgi:excisionase family DNA binding protein